MTTTNPSFGLTAADVLTRRQQYGFNEVLEERGHPLRRLLSKFWGISAWMLELIMLVSAVLGKYSDLIVVAGLLLVNAGLSYWLEGRAAGAVAALRQWLRVNARVLRDSAWLMIPSRELVPGDIVRIRAGDIVPADLKLLTGNLSVDQSALTGESNNAEKHPGDSVTSGSTAKRGEATAEVQLIGAQTYFGRTTELVQHAQPKLHIEAVVSQVVRWLFIIVGTLLALVVVLSLVRHASLVEMIPLMLVLLNSDPGNWQRGES
jgi:H+-transporting ATPase